MDAQVEPQHDLVAERRQQRVDLRTGLRRVRRVEDHDPDRGVLVARDPHVQAIHRQRLQRRFDPGPHGLQLREAVLGRYQAQRAVQELEVVGTEPRGHPLEDGGAGRFGVVRAGRERDPPGLVRALHELHHELIPEHLVRGDVRVVEERAQPDLVGVVAGLEVAHRRRWCLRARRGREGQQCSRRKYTSQGSHTGEPSGTEWFGDACSVPTDVPQQACRYASSDPYAAADAEAPRMPSSSARSPASRAWTR